MFENNPNKLYKNRERGKLTGVCAGLSDFFGVNVTAIRVGMVAATVFGGFPFFIAYVVLWLLLDPRPEKLYDNAVEEHFWRTYRRSPAEMNATLKSRYDGISRRIADIETVVTSPKYSLQREFDQLK